jgi:hypothetical protein
MARFYTVLPAAGRKLVDENLGLTLNDLHKLFRTFADEFMDTFRVM